MHSAQAPVLLTLEEVSAETRIPVNTLRYYRQKGVGPKFAKLGGRLMARRDDVIEWVNQAFEVEAR